MKYIDRLFENKNHLIDKLNLTDTQKEEIKAFFAKHSSYENKIDWNNKNLTYDDFKPILALDGKSKTQAKNRGIEGLVEGVDYRYFGEGSNSTIGKYRIYQPLSYLGSKTLASNRVPPEERAGAQWCISYQKTDKYWKDYSQAGIKFLFVFTADTKYAITKPPLIEEIEVYSSTDRNLGYVKWCKEDQTIQKALETIPSIKEESLKKCFITNPDGSISFSAESLECEADFFKLSIVRSFFRKYIKEHIQDGKFTVRLKSWDTDFDCSYADLKSLEGAPRYVKGDFDCFRNKLTSLEGAPEYIGGDFDCSQNEELQSLEGAPKEIKGSFESRGCISLKTLKGVPKKIRRNFDCSYSGLVTLEEGPERVGGDFWCRSCDNLTSLKGAPKYVGRDFVCSYNDGLKTLKGAPEYVGKDFNFDCCSNITSFEGIPEHIKRNLFCYGCENLSSYKGFPQSVGKNFNRRYSKKLPPYEDVFPELKERVKGRIYQ